MCKYGKSLIIRDPFHIVTKIINITHEDEATPSILGEYDKDPNELPSNWE